MTLAEIEATMKKHGILNKANVVIDQKKLNRLFSKLSLKHLPFLVAKASGMEVVPV